MEDKTQSKKQIAYEKIKESIISGDLRSGQAVSERELCEALGMSRTPVREAMISLVKEGMLTSEDGKGVCVANIHFEDMIEIYDVRDVLECLAVRLTADRATDQERAHLKKLYDREVCAMERGDASSFMTLDMEFHLEIARLSRNKHLYDMISSIYAPITMMAALTKNEAAVQASAVEMHGAIINAIMSKSIDGAVAAMHEHIAFIRLHHINRYYLFKDEN